MIFIDPVFLFLFLPTTLFAFYTALLTHGRNEALLVIFAASICFYLPYGVSSAVLLLAALLVNFSTANALLVLKDSHPWRAETLVWVRASIQHSLPLLLQIQNRHCASRCPQWCLGRYCGRGNTRRDLVLHISSSGVPG